MNRKLVALGVAVAVVGGLLWYFPLQPSSTGAQQDTGHTYVIELDAPVALLGASIPFTLEWKTGFPTVVDLFRCGYTPACSDLPHSDYLTGGSGTSGTLKWRGTEGEYFALTSSYEPVTVTLSYPEPLLGGVGGVGVLGLGALLTALGVYAVPPSAAARRPPAAKTDGAEATGTPEGPGPA